MQTANHCQEHYIWSIMKWYIVSRFASFSLCWLCCSSLSSIPIGSSYTIVHIYMPLYFKIRFPGLSQNLIMTVKWISMLRLILFLSHECLSQNLIITKGLSGNLFFFLLKKREMEIKKRLKGREGKMKTDMMKWL